MGLAVYWEMFGSIHGLDLLAGPLQVVLPHNHTPSDAWRGSDVLPADADMQRAALTCSILANLAVRSDAWPASRTYLGGGWFAALSGRVKRSACVGGEPGAEGEDAAVCLAPEREGNALVLMGDQAVWDSSPGDAGLRGAVRHLGRLP